MAIELTDSTIEKLADQLITKGKDYAKTESEKELRNTKDLLKYYRLLGNHVDLDMPELKDKTILSKYELSLYSLLGYRARTKEMIMFINEVMSRYKAICMNGTKEQRRRYKVIDLLYIQPQPVTRRELAKELHYDEKTIRRDERIAVNELSIMIFGIDGLNDMSK